MSEMVERVAKIFAPLAWVEGDYQLATGTRDYMREWSLQKAREVIECMQLPTKEMEEAGFQAGSVGDGGDHWEYADPASTYMAMIAEALKGID